tara:strand:- start:362 stop:745 length:384 start_codon:yes stop_codon:yes gene_type:complete
MEKFKQSWNYYYVITITPILLLYNVISLYLYFNIKQNGGNEQLYYTFLSITTISYGFSFFNDYAILNLFHIMKNQSCPCQVTNRKILTISTWTKLVINVIIYVTIISKTDIKLFNKIYKKVNKKLCL